MTNPPAYVIGQVDAHDHELLRRYVDETVRTFRPYGGIPLVADDAPTVLEGSWIGPRTVVVRFDDRAAAFEWYESDAYRAAAVLRRRAGQSNIVVAAGLQ